MSPTVVRCTACKSLLAEPPDSPAESRRPCSNCGSLTRTFETMGAVTAGAAVAPSIVPGEKRLVDAGYRVEWVDLRDEGGPWLVRVFDDSGAFIEGSIQDDPQDALAAVLERLLPG